MIANRLRMVNWSNYCYPTDVVKPRSCFAFELLGVVNCWWIMGPRDHNLPNSTVKFGLELVSFVTMLSYCSVHVGPNISRLLC